MYCSLYLTIIEGEKGFPPEEKCVSSNERAMCTGETAGRQCKKHKNIRT